MVVELGFGFVHGGERERERERERGGKEERHKLDRKDYFLGYIFY